MLILSISGCKTQQKSSENTNTDHSATQIAPKPFVTALPHIVIYKTTKNYSQNVPVILLKIKCKLFRIRTQVICITMENLHCLKFYTTAICLIIEELTKM